MAFVALERLIDFEEGYRRVFRVNHCPVLLLKHQGQAHAIQAFCPHKDWSFRDAEVVGDDIICPNHGARFCLDTGEPTRDCMIKTRPLQVYPVIFEGIWVGIEAEEDTDL